MVTAWKRDAREPFASNNDFWVSVGASVDALLALVLAAALTLVFGLPAVVAFLIPAALLVRAGMTGRRSASYTKTLFASRDEWRDAERQAVWFVLAAAVIRPRWRSHRA